ncbi:MAG TPA: hypothetical protein VF414_15410, partial [Thermoanaerobaculia bacterium]
MNRIGVLLLSGFLISAIGCGKSAPDEAAASTPTPETAATPELPADVRDIAAVAKAEEGPEVAENGESSEGTVSATGELVAPVTSEVAVRMPGRVGK